MGIVVFVVAVVVSLADPLLVIGYVGAGVLARNWRLAAIYGLVAGAIVVGLLALMAGSHWQPKPHSVAAQLAASLIGAVVVRLVIDRLRKRLASA